MSRTPRKADEPRLDLDATQEKLDRLGLDGVQATKGIVGAPDRTPTWVDEVRSLRPS